ncbi:hypothetical protein GCM10010486_54450 [Nonomuraea roseoviolacea subsp. carminata]
MQESWTGASEVTEAQAAAPVSDTVPASTTASPAAHPVLPVRAGRRPGPGRSLVRT